MQDKTLTFPRLIKYYLLRFVRLKGEPRELALGMALGIFSGMMPIIPFHTALAIALALIFKGSKITAAIGCWISNPLDWVVLYYMNYKIGAVILGLSENNKSFAVIMDHLRHGEEGMTLIRDIMSASGPIIGAFLLGGLIMGIFAGIPSYFIYLNIFSCIKKWRDKRKRLKTRRKSRQ